MLSFNSFCTTTNLVTVTSPSYSPEIWTITIGTLTITNLAALPRLRRKLPITTVDQDLVTEVKAKETSSKPLHINQEGRIKWMVRGRQSTTNEGIENHHRQCFPSSWTLLPISFTRISLNMQLWTIVEMVEQVGPRLRQPLGSSP